MAKRGKKRIHKTVWEFCGAGTSEKNKICGHCRYKIKLIRQIQQMIRDTYEREQKNGKC